MVWQEEAGFFLALEAQNDGGGPLLHAHDHNASEYRALDPAPGADGFRPPRLLLGRDAGALAEVLRDGQHRRWLAVLSDEAAPDGRLAAFGLEGRGEEAQTLLAHEAGRRLEGLALTAERGLLAVREGGDPALLAMELKTDSFCRLDAPEEVGELGLIESREYGRPVLYLRFSSPRTPPGIWAVEGGKIALGEAPQLRLLWRKTVPDHDPEDYEVERLAYESAGGARVLGYLLRRKDDARPTAPTLLYAYGAYGISENGAWRASSTVLADCGVRLAAARVRGGSDLGRGWYEAGRLAEKDNTFADAIAFARGLIGEERTAPEMLGLMGGSAGGLLVGAVLNRAPELFAAALALVPFVDVLNTMLDDSLPLTPPEWSEWGNPMEDKAAFERLRSYAPYENVADLPYPPLLATAGLSDPRVTYWEPAKWVQRLRAAGGGARGPILLATQMEAGHGGASGRYKRLEEIARDWAFLLLALKAHAPD